MIVIDWLQTSEFIHENSERFILYCLCGYFIGITIILLAIILLLYIEKQQKTSGEHRKIKNQYETPRNDIDYNSILSNTHSYQPVYRYDGRNHLELYHI